MPASGGPKFNSFRPVGGLPYKLLNGTWGRVRVSTQWVEVLTSGDPTSNLVRVSAQSVDAITSGDTAAQKMRVSQFYLELIFSQNMKLTFGAIFTDTDTFYSPTVTSTAFITPDLFDDSDTFYAPSVSGQVSLAPSLVVDDDTFYAPAVQPGAVTLLPGLAVDDDTFYSPIVSIGAVALTPALVTDIDTIYSPTVTIEEVVQATTLSHDIGRIIDQDQIYPPTVTSTYFLQPSLVTDAFEQIISPQVVQAWQLLPGLVVDTDNIIVGPTVIPGPVTLLPQRVVDTDTFLVPFVSRSGQTGGGGGGGGGGGNVSKDLKYASSLVMPQAGQIIMLGANINTAKPNVNTRMMIYADQAGQPGALLGTSGVKNGVTLGDNLYPLLTPVGRAKNDVIWIALHSDASNVNWLLISTPQGSRFNNDVFSDGPSNPFGPSSNDNKKAPVFAIYMESATATISPPLVTDTDTFQGVASISKSNTLAPSFIIADDIIWPPAEQATDYVQPDQKVSDADTFYAPSVSSSYTLLPGLVIDSDIVLQPSMNTVQAPDQQITSPQFLDTDQFYPPEVIPQGATLDIPLYLDDDDIPAPEVSAYNELFIEDFLVDEDIIPAPEVTSTYSIDVPLWEDQDQFEPATVTVTQQDQFLSADLWVDDDVFWPPRIQLATMRRTVDILGTRESRPSIGGDRTSGADILGEREPDIDVEGEP